MSKPRPKFADCRKCIFFTKYPPRKHGYYLGYCSYWEKGITHYKGYCRAYTPKQIKQHSLKEYGIVR